MKNGKFLLPGQNTGLVVKSGICFQKLESKTFWTLVINQVDTSFWCNFLHFSTIIGRFFSGGKVFSQFQPGHETYKTRVKSARSDQKMRKNMRR